MKTAFVVAAIVLWISILEICGCGPESTGKETKDSLIRNRVDPVLSCEAPTVDFGEVYRPVSEALTHSYTLVNESQKTLRLAVEKKSCSCTKVELSVDVLPPGEKAECHVEWTVPSRLGKAEFGVLLSANTETKHGVALQGNVIVRDTVAVNPLELDFEDMKPNEEKSLRLTISAPPGEMLLPEVALSGTENLGPEISIKRILETENSRTFEVVMSCRDEQGQSEWSLTLITGSPKQPTIEIPVRVSRLPVYQAVPAAIVLRGNGGGDPPTPVEIVANTDRPVEIETISADDPRYLDVTTRIVDGKRVLVDILPKSSVDLSGPKTGKVEIRLKGRQYPLEITYLYLLN